MIDDARQPDPELVASLAKKYDAEPEAIRMMALLIEEYAEAAFEIQRLGERLALNAISANLRDPSDGVGRDN